VAETSDKTEHSQETIPMLPAGLEPTIPTVDRPQTRTLDRAGCANYRPKVRCALGLFLPSDLN